MAKTNNNPTEVLISDTGDDRQGEAELAFALRDTPDDGDWRDTDGDYAHRAMLFETAEAESELNRGKKEENDDPGLSKDMLEADMEVSPLTSAAMADQPYCMDKPGFVFPPASDGQKTGKPKRLSVEEVREMVHRLFTSFTESGLADYAPIVPFFEALDFVVRQEVEKGKVSKILGVRAAYLWSALEILEKLASENLARISKDRNAKEFFANRKNIWIGSAIDRAKYVLKLQHSTLLPAEGVEFKPQWMDAELRKKIQDLLVELQKVVKFATCANDGKHVGIGRNGEPFLTCAACHATEQKTQKKAQELADLNLKLAEKKELLRPVENLLVDLTAAANGWVAGEVARGWLKAQVAFDNNFGSTLIAWHTKKVADIDVSIVTGKITDVDRAAVEAEKGYLMKVIEEIRTFKHLTYCPTCFMPTYPMAGYHGATKPCETCQSSSRKAAATDDGDLKDLAEAAQEAQEAGVGFTSADGKVLAVAEVTAPAFDPGGKYMDAWQRNLSGKKKDESKKEKREKREKKEKKVK